jgi:5-methylthioadenosine/S-adenosylhomocysteine deaminase
MYMAHMGWTSWEELDMLKKHDVKIAHCPSASMQGGYGCIAHGKFPEMLDKGITITLGHDSASCGRSLDMFFVMYLAAAGHKDARVNPLVIGPYKALEMATIDCARGLLWEDKIGSLEVGKRADIITLNMNTSEWWPMWNVVANLVYSADGSCVDNVIVDGKIIMRNKKILTVDEMEVIQKIKKKAQDMKDRLKLELPSKWKIV